MKPACSLVDNASLGPQLPALGSGRSRLPVTRGGWAGLQPASLCSVLGSVNGPGGVLG